MTSGGQSERLFEAYSIPSPARPLFQTAFGNTAPQATSTKRAPLQNEDSQRLTTASAPPQRQVGGNPRTPKYCHVW